MQSSDLAQQLAASLTVHARQPAAGDDHGIWIRIPTQVMRVQEGPAAGGSWSPALAPTATPASTSAPETPAGVFRLRGHLRELGFAGQQISLREMQGFRIYAQLLARPHTRVPAVELRAGLAGVDQALFAGSSGPVVTAAALGALRRAYEELSEELAEAELDHDAARTERLQAELQQVAGHVRRAVGKNGQPRQASDAERARVAVAKALGRARTTLQQHHPQLAAHLARCVQTGVVLCYQPDHPVRWDLGRDGP